MGTRRGKPPEQTLFAFAQEHEDRRRGVDDLFSTVHAYAEGRRFLQLLGVVGRLDSYGPYNAFLAALQRPRARCVLPPSGWRRYNREVKKGAIPIVMLRPFAPVTCVFDVADTRVIRGREDRVPEAWLAEDDRSREGGDVPEAIVRTLLDRLPWWGIRHMTVPTGPSAAGELHLADVSVPEIKIWIRPGVAVDHRPAYVLETRAGASSTDLFTALVHALARLFCHHLHCAFEKGWSGGRSLSSCAEDFEADVVLWLVSRRLRVACPACRALSERLAANGSIPDISMDRVLDAVAEIERMLGGCTYRDGALFRLSPSFAAACGARAVEANGLDGVLNGKEAKADEET